jgi:hypothetical protein
MLDMATRGAVEEGLRKARQGVDAAACAARLARVGGRDFDERTTGPGELVAEQVGETRPSRIRDAASAVTSNHSRDVQLFRHDDAVALGES